MLLSIISTWQEWLNRGNLAYEGIALLLYAIAVLIVISVFAYVFGWAERKLIAKIQHRHGPTYVGKYGILQNLADLVKLLAKEHVTPENSDRLLLALSPILMLSITTFMILLLPFSPSLQASSLGLGLLFVFVLIAFMPIVIFLAGFSTGNKFADISAQRSVLMLVSYEIPLLVVVASAALLSGTYNIGGIVAAQSGLHWFIILMPIGFIVFFITMIAEMERPPFDLREADSELIAGWLTDYSGPYYALALFIDYTRMFLAGLLIALLFLGGWSGPLLPGFAWLLIKAFIVAMFTIVIRATTVRMRIDRILRLGWIWLLPLSLINLIFVYILFVV
ncbi:MAG: complex I subunit 1 family protein [Candidatus Micrarchaeaceae archaeon]